jgi:hypothetical protein
MGKKAELIIDNQTSLVESDGPYGFSMDEIRAFLGGTIQRSSKENKKYLFASNEKILAISLDGLCFCWSGGDKTC